ncbi:hypothetical protein XENORESO_005618 [Xenotaenia resolanae]|uniref:Uncharacterized protein n=1 Tax=Xenotaenia resolanae TaxID=208358 RepID=A0ABV0VV33_9TELE
MRVCVNKIPKRKDISNDYHLGRVSIQGHEWKTFKTVAYLPGVDIPANSLQVQIVQCSEKLGKTCQRAQTLQALVSRLNIEVYDRTVRKSDHNAPQIIWSKPNITYEHKCLII